MRRPWEKRAPLSRKNPESMIPGFQFRLKILGIMIFARQKEKERLFPDSAIMAAINTRTKHRTGYLFRAERGEPPRGREARRPSTDPLRTRPCPVAVGRDDRLSGLPTRAAQRTRRQPAHRSRPRPFRTRITLRRDRDIAPYRHYPRLIPHAHCPGRLATPSPWRGKAAAIARGGSPPHPPQTT